jgi:hypothetical protein
VEKLGLPEVLGDLLAKYPEGSSGLWAGLHGDLWAKYA